ncbi:hypothetical protein LOTGIDRAFT_159569 [Lottia gigantea]|uniref:HTH psq-type domain-containing protein n=1 Tax=Lottia gigantea TaxID=225164 RepID=V4APW9_LOTGI|nr:hypothetical protein LOTGIDRAFT_159569 [Lottia gigantea]ESO96825.1 hypothetical protein LOTGIDRAFT_159569 [Lottia gigantea]
MVDCGNPRCAQERRSFRKELISWGKKVPVLIAYEAIAGHFGGNKVSETINNCYNGKIFFDYSIISCPYSYNIHKFHDKTKALERETPEDFAPEKDCIYCESKLASIVDIVTKLTDDAKKGRIDPDNANLRYLQDLLPFCTQYYTQHAKKESTEEDIEDSSNNNNKSQIQLKVPQLPIPPGKSKKELLTNGKRAYSDDDLVSAVGDIRSGKLGTRRASTLYGIPRSTLRNKIFKMEIDDQNAEDSSSIEELEKNMKLTDLMQAGSFAFLPPLPFVLPFQKEDISPEEMQRRIEIVRQKHNIDGTFDVATKPAHVNELKLPLLSDLIHKLVEQRFEMECQKSASKKNKDGDNATSFALGNPFTSPLTAAYLSSLVSADEKDIRIPSYKGASPTHNNNNNNNHLSEKSKLYGKVYEEGRIGETLKDIIMKTITEKMRFRDGSDSSSEADVSSPLRSHFSNKISSQMTIPSSKYSNNHSPAKRSRKDKKEEVTPPNANALKKTRPKRGQYRKYNSALLMEAVKAVQRGEMSVHRAGSYYGVPHSTLEYKVKERHLLRQKKLREQQPAKESKINSTTSNTEEGPSPSKTPKKSESSKASLNFSPGKDASSTGLPWYQPYINTNPDIKPELNFFPSGFALSTPASELLRKLQHKVQNKSPNSSDTSFEFPTTTNGTNSNGNTTSNDSFMPVYN